MSIDAQSVTVVALLAPAVGRLEVDPLSGAVSEDPRGAEMSVADAAALEVALSLGETWSADTVALSAGGDAAVTVLRDACAHGVDRAVRLAIDGSAPPELVGGALADTIRGLGQVVVIAGVHGSDVASAATPGFIAHHLGAAQALGLIGIEPTGPGSLDVVRRLDRGAREHLRLGAPAVVSVEGSVASLRRASLAAALAAGESTIETLRSERGASEGVRSLHPRPYRPRPQVVAPPSGTSALARVRDLTGATDAPTPARAVELDPDDAAELILEQLGDWGYGPHAEPGD